MKTRPVTVIIAAVLLALLALSNFPTRVPGAAGAANGNRANRTFNNGNTAGGTQNLPNDNNGGLPSTGNGAGGSFNPNGTRFRQQTTILGIRSSLLIQLGLLFLNLVFLVLGLAAAIGLFQLKRSGLVLGLIVVAYNLIIAGRSIYNYLSFMSLRASGAFNNFGGAGGAGGAFTGFRLSFPILAVVQIVVAIAVAVLALLPVTRKALVTTQRHPVTTVA